MIDTAPTSFQLSHDQPLEHAIRRTSEAPERIDEVLKTIGSQPQRKSDLVIQGPQNGIPEGVSLRLRSSKWWGYSDLDLDDAVQFRDLVGALFIEDRPIGAVIFHEVRFDPFIGHRLVLECLDAQSAAWIASGQTLFRHWSYESVLELGMDRFHLVDFSTLWVHPEAPAGHWHTAVRRLIRQRYQGRAHLMLLKPFPLEYEGQGKFVGDAEIAFVRRRTAMTRLYNRSLGAVPLDDPESSEPWMYLPLSPDLPEPSLQLDTDF